ncbi:hypothetical protein NXS19_005510 [Fusarium pseudograminearum]|nr:hypothetical protein NXS19_005510 [Fusarium pseudograminearum]
MFTDWLHQNLANRSPISPFVLAFTEGGSLFALFLACLLDWYCGQLASPTAPVPPSFFLFIDCFSIFSHLQLRNIHFSGRRSSCPRTLLSCDLYLLLSLISRLSEIDCSSFFYHSIVVGHIQDERHATHSGNSLTPTYGSISLTQYSSSRLYSIPFYSPSRSRPSYLISTQA